MDIKEYADEYFDSIYNVVHKTIEEIYPKYYPQSAVDFFHNYHSKENMRNKLFEEKTLVLLENKIIIGTASLKDNDIGRFFILPEYQNKGYGKKLLTELENKMDKNKYNHFILVSSLGAVYFYKKCNYKINEYKIITLEDGYYLCYLEMIKRIK